MAPEDAEQPPASPGYDPDRRAEPRLGILHVLGAIACVAAYFGLAQTARFIAGRFPAPFEIPVVVQTYSVLFDLGSGIALSGLLLWLARRRWGMAFPRHPGEYMLVVQATICVVSLAYDFLISYLFFLSEREPATRSVLLLTARVGNMTCVIDALIWTVAGLRIGNRPWRWFFFLSAASRVLVGLLYSGLVGPFWNACYVPYVLVASVLVVILVRDHRQGMRYPWSHWLGVAIQLWFALLYLGFNVLETFFPHWLHVGP